MEKSNRNSWGNANNSEALRLASLKRQKETFKNKEKLIRDALKSVDGSSQNKKIVFDDNVIESYGKHVEKRKKNQLFDGADDDDVEDPENEIFNFDEDKTKPTVKIIGNDSRFTIDERFETQNDDDIHDKKTVDDDDNVDEFTNEKNKEMEILQSVLGKPIQKRDTKFVSEKRTSKMVRYDPSGNDHHQHELKNEKENSAPKKKRKTVIETPVVEEVSIPVSSNIFYSVSDNLTQSLNVQETGFSMLKTFGAANNDCDTKLENNTPEENSILQKQNLMANHDFSKKNPFRYDSTDDEDDNFNEAQNTVEVLKKQSTKEKTSKDTFFFSLNDSRFIDAMEFFKKESTLNNKEFGTVRRELKQIVRSKMRNNARKAQPRKNKITTMKSRKR